MHRLRPTHRCLLTLATAGHALLSCGQGDDGPPVGGDRSAGQEAILEHGDEALAALLAPDRWPLDRPAGPAEEAAAVADRLAFYSAHYRHSLHEVVDWLGQAAGRPGEGPARDAITGWLPPKNAGHLGPAGWSAEAQRWGGLAWEVNPLSDKIYAFFDLTALAGHDVAIVVLSTEAAQPALIRPDIEGNPLHLAQLVVAALPLGRHDATAPRRAPSEVDAPDVLAARLSARQGVPRGALRFSAGGRLLPNAPGGRPFVAGLTAAAPGASAARLDGLLLFGDRGGDKLGAVAVERQHLFAAVHWPGLADGVLQWFAACAGTPLFHGQR